MFYDEVLHFAHNPWIQSTCRPDSRWTGCGALSRRFKMLLALLYCDDDRIAAAAMACDQVPLGDRYWNEIFPGEIQRGDMFETAYVTVANADLRERLLKIGIDVQYDGRELAQELIESLIPNYLNRAA